MIASSNTSTDDTVKSNEYLSSSDTIVAEITTSTPLNNIIDYKACYEECQRELAIQREKFPKRVIQLTSECEVLKEKHEELEDNSKGELETIKGNYESAINKKDQLLVSQRKNLESNESSKSEYKKAINEKDEEIASQKEIIKCCKETLYDGRKNLTKENMFRIKPKKSGKKGNTTSSTTVDSLKCEFAECDIDDVDMIKCNVCEKWVCEDCNDVPVAKLKSIINKCQTVYFICKACVRNHATENGDVNNIELL